MRTPRPAAPRAARSNRTAAALLLTPLALAACRSDPLAQVPRDPLAPYLVVSGDPVRGAALNATWDIGPTARPRNASEAAVAALQVERLAEAYSDDAIYRFGTDPTLAPALAGAREEVRGALGISPALPPREAQVALYRAALALREGDRERAEDAFSGPAFALGGPGTVGRLAAMPPLPRAEAAASLVASSPLRPFGDQSGSRRR